MVLHRHHRYRLDNSGIIHLAVLKKGISNSFRLSVSLTETVQPDLLQKALENITPRFPMLVAGIAEGIFHHYVIPVKKVPGILPDTEPLVYMSKKQIRQCAMRVLYDDHHISAEFFHSLTDGYGGSQFLKSLLAEYLYLVHGILFRTEHGIIVSDSKTAPKEIEDSFLRYAKGKPEKFNSIHSYQLKSKAEDTDMLHTTTFILDLPNMLSAAHAYNTTLTGFLTALIADTIMEHQILYTSDHSKVKPVQIMVPVNLRKHFPSETLRNFTLYALACIHPEDVKLSFSALSALISEQLNQQIKKEFLSSMIATNVCLQETLKWLPLKLKCMGLRIGFHFIGAKNSCLTLSNLGEFALPESMEPYVEQADFLLTPRMCSSYNCGVVSYQNQLHINFTRRGISTELECIFMRKLTALGLEFQVKMPADIA